MKTLSKLLFSFAFLLSGTFVAMANNGGGGDDESSNTHGSTCTVKSNNDAAGLVYANCAKTTKGTLSGYTHTKPAGPSDEDYVDQMTVTCESPGGGTSCEQMYYLYAKPNPGYKFVKWEGSQNSTEQNYDMKVTHSTKLPNHNPYNMTAYFVEVNAVNTETNLPVGEIVLEPEAPQIGETVTAGIKTHKLSQNNSAPNKNMMVVFDHWEDELGNNLGTEETITFDVDREMTLKAIYRDLSELPQKGKYYRVRNVYNRVLSVEGNMKVNIPMTGIDIDDSILRWALTFDHNYDDFKTSTANNDWDEYEKDGKIWAEASPGTIFYMSDGKKNGSDFESGVLSSQGIDTKTLTGQTLKVTPMDQQQYFGYYGVVATAASGAAFQAMPRSAGWEDYPLARCVVNVSAFKSASLNCALAVQPIDEDHIDDFWFGAYAEEEMAFEDGYWTTMYAAFPYKIYDTENVEAYYVKNDVEKVDGISYLHLTKVEDGIIPAESAVLLKCKVAESTKANRLLPLNPSDVRKKELEGNILKGCIQLYTKADKSEGYEKFDPVTMRILGVNNKGEVGFYKLGTDENGQQVNLTTNKAYLDLNMITSDASAVSFRLAPAGVSTGIETIGEDGSSIRYEDNVVYDLTGRKVSHPEAGGIYIVNGRKVVWK